jgi:hypothetical protein
MLYKNVKVEQISISVYMGEKYVKNEFRKNQEIFRKKVSKQNAICGFGYECPIEDLICIYPDGMGELGETTSKSDYDKIISVYDEMSKIFEDVKVNLYLEDFLEEGNSIDLSKEEFINYVG